MRKPVVYSVLLAALIFVAGPLVAGDTEVLDIKPPTAAAVQRGNEPDLHEGKFDGYGVIDSINDKTVVINDMAYRLSGGIVYKYLDGRSATVGNFPIGTSVWFVLYADNIIKSVWKEGG
ncbi:MAG: hypothetical protein GY697_05780 [Desulfobacterales bacterium]|nr:hypothetical protein [Desulfobacterales bacterium]